MVRITNGTTFPLNETFMPKPLSKKQSKRIQKEWDAQRRKQPMGIVSIGPPPPVKVELEIGGNLAATVCILSIGLVIVSIVAICA